MKKLTSFSLLITILVSVFFISCQKKKEDKLAETWKLIKVSKDTMVDYYETWDFDGSKILIVRRNDVLNSFDTLSNGTYSVDAGLSKTFINMENMANSAYNGKWQILKINNDILVMLNESNGNWVYREFVIK